MKKLITIVVAASLVACNNQPEVAPASGQVKAYQESWSWTGVLNYSPYTVENNVWNGGSSGSQKIWANSASNWGAQASFPNTSGVKSYPNENLNINKKFSSVNTLKSSFNVSVPSSGVWDVAWDIWFNNYDYEVMVWEKWKDCSPIAQSYGSNGPNWSYTNVNIGGQTFNVCRGYTDHECISFVATSQTTSKSNIDLKAICNWVSSHSSWYGGVTRNYDFGNKTLSRVGFGFEVTSTNNTYLNFTANSYSITSN